MIKKYWAVILLAFSIIFFVYKRIEKANSFYSYKTIYTKAGWGYEIYSEKTLFIRQENIPAVNGVKGFATKEDAEKVGEFIVLKLKATNKDLPQITVEELDSLKVIH
ncbi:MAG: DUF4907 domain-containing protein [Bacteroidetes bacterium]|jgi:hypothetical protein|nr:DUF4907 domain-containing protein [Bacteroidota bacterium]